MSNCTVRTLRQPAAAAMRPLTNAELDDVSGGSVSVSDGAVRLGLGPVGLAIGDQRGYVMNGIRAALVAQLLGH